jgi:hypothetical protein
VNDSTLDAWVVLEQSESCFLRKEVIKYNMGKWARRRKYSPMLDGDFGVTVVGEEKKHLTR